jgi:hypothetical protein
MKNTDTVVMIVLNNLENMRYIEAIIDKLMVANCIAFVSWGRYSDLIHDEIDRIIEIRSMDMLSAVTISQQCEEIQYAVKFFIESVCIDSDDYCCVILYDMIDKSVDCIIREAINFAVDVQGLFERP